jgi:hypothetical protein
VRLALEFFFIEQLGGFVFLNALHRILRPSHALGLAFALTHVG